MDDRDEVPQTGRRTAISVSRATALLILVLVSFAGFALGRSTSGPSASAADQSGATASPQVDQTPACSQPTATQTPAPTETPLPTATPTPVPPVAMGQPLAYAGDWTVVVTGFVPAPSANVAASGKFVQVNVTVTNNASSGRKFPFEDWSLVDAGGRVFKIADNATSQLYGPNWYLSIDPSLATDFKIVFDVAADAGPAFILQSSADPTFRVAVQLQALG